ncbi:hypothetical protein [Legionella septentrionalis]|uniref:hypothetical protein n=1 Tax=Legionella septentrionalis TaxID=2498109 RepID=UPI000F8F0715|nr:hypothetical protein [Legionella septentrionalis]RUR09153.1 hypothetical protein ELY14_09670 [Legionella septentrionalis]
MGKDKIVRIFSQQNAKTTELLTSLQTLREYGETIKNKNKENKKEEAGKENAKDLNTIGGKAIAAEALAFFIYLQKVLSIRIAKP